MQVGKFLENIKRADQNKAMHRECFLKINKRADQNKAVQGEFLLKINKRACTSIWYTRVHVTLLKLLFLE